VRRKTGLREVLWAGPIVEELKCRNPEKDILVVTGRTEVFIDNPHADMVLTPAWIGEVNVDLDPVHENSTRDRLLEAYRQAAGVKDSPARARVHPSSSERQFVEGTLAAHAKRMIACHPAASPAVSSWPAEQWAELVRRLQAEHTVVLLGERGSHEFSAPGVLSFIGKELPLSLIAAFLSKAELLVSPQHSELSEIAAAVETPVVLLCGTAVPEAQLRFTEQFALVRSPFDCAACVSDGAGASPPPICVYGMGEGRCMKAITVEMVMKGIAEALRRRSPARGVAT
jgi:ADP-heptose:LPS heptosyltransferase